MQGIVFGYIFSSDPAARRGTRASLIVSTLLLVIGVLMLITAFTQWDKEDDPDAPPPEWMAVLGRRTAPKAFGMGAAQVAIAAKQWVFNLSAGFLVYVLFVVLETYLRVDAAVSAWTLIGLFFAIRALAVRYDWRTQPVLPHAEGQ